MHALTRDIPDSASRSDGGPHVGDLGGRGGLTALASSRFGESPAGLPRLAPGQARHRRDRRPRHRRGGADRPSGRALPRVQGSAADPERGRGGRAGPQLQRALAVLGRGGERVRERAAARDRRRAASRAGGAFTGTFRCSSETPTRCPFRTRSTSAFRVSRSSSASAPRWRSVRRRMLVRPAVRVTPTCSLAVLICAASGAVFDWTWEIPAVFGPAVVCAALLLSSAPSVRKLRGRLWGGLADRSGVRRDGCRRDRGAERAGSEAEPPGGRRRQDRRGDRSRQGREVDRALVGRSLHRSWPAGERAR